MRSGEPVDLSRVRGAVFDLDGTLVDAFEGIAAAVNVTRARFDLPPLDAAMVRRQVGRGLEDLLDRVIGPDRPSDTSTMFRAAYEVTCEQGCRPMPGADLALADLAERGYRLAVASNKLRGFSLRLLERLGMAAPLVAVEGPDSAGTTKPDPAMIRACLSAMALDAGAAVYVGDMVLDVEAAARAGLPALLVAGGASPEEALRATGAPVFDDLPALAAALPRRAPASGGGVRGILNID